MGGINVKITMMERLLQIVAPHPCSGCSKIGTILCQDCKYDIISESFIGCILCGKPQKTGICINHNSPIARAFVVGSRAGALEEAINRLKFRNTKQASVSLADLMHTALPLFPRQITIVPIPTVTSHIRQRGYDHVDLIVRRFALQRSMNVKRLLFRKTSDTQHTVGRKDRQQQSRRTFGLKAGSDIDGATILLVDDVITTGSTLTAAATLLREAGATVWVAALAYQPLD